MEKSPRKTIPAIAILLIIYSLLSLIGITNPPLEIGHNWRQTVTAMMARNFYTHDATFLYPEVDMTGNKSGIIGSEFPIFPQLIAYANQLFGFQHWYGRLINLVISIFGAMAFYASTKQLFSKRIAFNSTAILLCSIWFSFARKIMPDTFSISLALIGNYFLLQWVLPYLPQVNSTKNPDQNIPNFNAKKNPIGRLTQYPLFNAIGYILFSSLAILTKLPALLWLTPAACFVLFVKTPSQFKISIIIASITLIIPVVIWYYLWVPELNKHFQLFYPKTLKEGWIEFLPFWKMALERFYFTALYSFAALLFLLIGIFFFFKNQSPKRNISLLMMFLVFVIFIIKTGSVFPQHNYYVIPFVPILAIITGIGITELIPFISKKENPIFTYLFLIIIGTEAILNQQHELFIKPSEQYKLQLEELGKSIPKNNLVISNSGINPQEIYLLNRRGWVVFSNQLCNAHFIDSLYHCGAKYILINKNLQENTDLEFCMSTVQNKSTYHFVKKHESKDYRLVAISSSQNPN